MAKGKHKQAKPDLPKEEQEASASEDEVEAADTEDHLDTW